MQQLFAKYGLAAHLAILAVAPLFLFPFWGEGVCVSVLLWLSVPAGFWVLLEPSVRRGEHLRDSRRRVAWAIFRDPLFWLTVALVLFTGLRALNTGVALSYDAEKSVWGISPADIAMFPGSVGAAGQLPFAASVAFAILLQGCRHALGRSARMVFLLLASFLSGLAAVLAVGAVAYGLPNAQAALRTVGGDLGSFAGVAFGLYLLAGLVALVASFEQHWKPAPFLLVLSIGGNAAGLLAFSPVYLAAGLAVSAGVLLAYCLVYARTTTQASGTLKQLVLVGIAMALGGLMLAALLPQGVQIERMRAFKNLYLFPVGFWTKRAALSTAAFKSWMSHLWAGTGVASFPIGSRFVLGPEDWRLFPQGARFVTNGWWQILSERGLVGFVFVILPFVFLLFTYSRRLVGSLRTGLFFPHPACLLGILALVLFVGIGFFDNSPIRADVLLATGALMAVSASSFPRRRGRIHG